MKKYTRPRHRVFFTLLRPIVWLIGRIYGFKARPYKADRNQGYLILSNHQAFWDPAFLSLVIKRPIYFVATDTLYSKKWYSRLLFYCFGPIKKRKGVADVACIRTMVGIAKEGGTIALFPEGNRQWNDSMFPIDRATVKLVQLLKLPVIFFNMHGGYGVQPRWGRSKRRGKYTGVVREIVSWEELSAMTDDELYNKISSSIKVIDPESGELYRSKRKAEYLERELFLCPKCMSADTLRSEGNEIHCSACGLSVSYGEDMHLHSDDPDFRFNKLVEWYMLQQDYVRSLDIEDGPLCCDDGVTLYDKTDIEQVQVASGRLTLSRAELRIGDFVIPTADILAASAVGGIKITLDTEGHSYMLVGPERFNGIKYLLLFNRVCPAYTEKGGDKYYGLSIDPNVL